MTQSYDKETCTIAESQSTLGTSLRISLAVMVFGGILALSGLVVVGIFDRVISAIGALFGFRS